VKVIVRQPVLPVLTLKEANPVLRLEFVKQASGDCAVQEIVCSLKGSTDLTDIEHIRLYASAADGTLSVEHPLTLPMQVSEKVSFKEPLVLKDDTTLVWVTLKLKDRVNLSHRVRLACSSVKTVKGKGEVLLDGSLVDLRLGVAKEVLEPMGKRLKGIRIDSGDLAYLSKKIRKMLDDVGLEDCKIVVSNSLDEYTITSILQQGGKIDSFGVGERLITAKSDPVFGAVYKISAVEENGTFAPRIKISENVEKITNPGLKDVYRIYDEAGHSVADLITKAGEKVDMSVPYRYADPVKPWKNRSFENCTAKKTSAAGRKGRKTYRGAGNLRRYQSLCGKTA
jgi:hypothetical protein